MAFNTDANDLITDTLTVRVIPSPRVSVCLEALKVQGMKTWGDLQEAEWHAEYEPKAFAGMVAFWQKHAGGTPDDWHRVTWAHNADFDYNFLRHMADRIPQTAGMFSRRPRWQCTKNLYGVCIAAGLLPDIGSTSLDTLCKQFGIERPEAHDALADAIAGAKCLAGLWKTLRG